MQNTSLNSKINFINIDIDKINDSNYDFIISNPPHKYI